MTTYCIIRDRPIHDPEEASSLRRLDCVRQAGCTADALARAPNGGWTCPEACAGYRAMTAVEQQLDLEGLIELAGTVIARARPRPPKLTREQRREQINQARRRARGCV